LPTFQVAPAGKFPGSQDTTLRQESRTGKSPHANAADIPA
jgi:hypothetical protein